MLSVYSNQEVVIKYYTKAVFKKSFKISKRTFQSKYYRDMQTPYIDQQPKGVNLTLRLSPALAPTAQAGSLKNKSQHSI